MSIRFTADADRLQRGDANLPAWNNYTIAGFFQLVADTGGPMCLFSLEENGSSWHVCETPGGGDLALHLYAGFGVDLNSGVTLTLGTWYFVSVTHSGTTVRFGICEVGNPSFTFASAGDTTAWAFALLVLMGNSFADPPNGRSASVRVWDAVLSDEDLLKESGSLAPVRSANLNAYYRWVNRDERLTDYGPNGYHLEEVGGGAWETEENPPGIAANVADLVSTLPGVTASMAASVGASADLTSTLPGISSSISAGHGVAGSLAGMLPGLTSSMSVSPGVAASFASTLPGVTSAMDVYVAPAGALESVLPGVTSAIGVVHGPSAALASTLPGVTSAISLRTPIRPTATLSVVAGPSATLVKA